MSRYLLDSNCLIYALSDAGHPVSRRMAACVPDELVISAISFAEVALGTNQSRPPTSEALDAFAAAIPVLPFDEAAAREYARLPFKRARFDRLLAAHALALGAVVVTANESDFSDVPGLAVENWAR